MIRMREYIDMAFDKFGPVPTFDFEDELDGTDKSRSSCGRALEILVSIHEQADGLY